MATATAGGKAGTVCPVDTFLPAPCPSGPALTLGRDGLGGARGSQHIAGGSQGQDSIEGPGAAAGRRSGGRIDGCVAILAIRLVGERQQAVKVALLPGGGHVNRGPALHHVARGPRGGGIRRQRRPQQLREGKGLVGKEQLVH